MNSSRFWMLLACAAAAVVVLIAGPPLGEHETIVALIARQTLQTGEWLVPHCLDTAFLLKPPGTPWAVAAVSRILPWDAATGLPVTALTARLPSMLATVLTIVVLHAFSRRAFGRRSAWITT